MNALMHSAQLCLKARSAAAAAEISDLAWNDRAQRDLRNGRRQIQGIHWLTIDAIAAAHHAKPEEALRLSVRALALMRAARGKRPEGYKDLAWCATWALGRIGDKGRAATARRIATEMVDGRSGFWTEPLQAK